MKGAPQPLFGGNALAEWIRAGGRPSRRIGALPLRLKWQAYWFEMNWRNQALRLQQAPLPCAPVFIVGLWRSGTTAFHELLTAVTGWNTPLTWQCFNPSTCFLTKAPRSGNSVARPMDQGRIATFSPQEDEFALLLLGGPSAYRGFIDPRRLDECTRLLRQDSERTLLRWLDFIRGVGAGSPATRLLIKSPSHSFRLPQVRRLLPDAKFIWIGRDVGELLASNITMWRHMIARYALWEAPEDALPAFLDGVVRETTAVLRQCLDDLPSAGMLWIDFEALRANPARVMERVLEYLEWHAPDGQSRATLVAEALVHAPVHPGSRGQWPADPAVSALEDVMAEARRRFSA